MPLATTREMLLDAKSGGYAIGAFNVDNMEMAAAVASAAENLNSPVIIQVTPSAIIYSGFGVLSSIVAAIAKISKIPIALHLDHGDSCQTAKQALRAGFTSLMFDGSVKSFKENIGLTARIVELSKPMNIPVEAELGRIAGKEDDFMCTDEMYTDPLMAKEFVERTGIDSLAVAIGTAHGVYSDIPVLDIARLRKIRKAVDIPLVLHGASGLSGKQVQECIKNGICKVNFSTEVKCAYRNGIEAFFAENPYVFDPKEFGAAGRDAVSQVVADKIKMCSFTE